MSDTDVIKMMDKLRKENGQLKMENSQLFKELDILNRKVRARFGKAGATLKSLMDADDVAYTVNTELSYSVPLSVFMDKFYKMYPQAQARLEVYERRGRQCSFAVPIERGILGRTTPTSGGVYDKMIRGWLGSPRRPAPPAEDDIDVEPSDSLPTTVTKQFARDLPSLIRINGRGVEGSSDNEKVVAAYNILLEATHHNQILTQKVMEVANQNLGILLYEDLVNHYSESGFLVKQTWYHYLDITFPPPSKHRSNQPSSEGEVMIYMLAIFELQSSDFENSPPLFIKSMLELTFAMSDKTLSVASPAPPGFLSAAAAEEEDEETNKGMNERMVNAIFSTPTFNILPFLHSVDITDHDLDDSASSSYVPVPTSEREDHHHHHHHLGGGNA